MLLRRHWTVPLAQSLTATALALGCGSGATTTAPSAAPTQTTAQGGKDPQPSPAPPAHVVVSLVVDQFAAWIASERLPLLPDNGGFARLRHEGTWVNQMRYEHAVTDTAPGHSALYTGATPRESGIFGNETPVPGSLAARTSILYDPNVHPIGVEGDAKPPSSSIARLKVDTVADSFRASHPDALIVALSLKDRGAIFGGGRHPTATLWYDTSLDRFITSSAFADRFPSWAAPLAGPNATSDIRAHVWNPLDVEWVRTHAATADAQKGEGDAPGFGTVFPHDPSQAKSRPLGLRLSPYADEALIALGLAALDGENAVKRDTLLAISFSTPDYIGHNFGPDSWEAWDELRRLDAALGRFFEELDKRFGREGYAVMLAADHGVISMPEVPASARAWCKPGAPTDPWQRPCKAGERIIPDDLARELSALTQKALGEGGWIAGVADPYVYLTDKARALLGTSTPRAATLRDALQKTLMHHPGVRALREKVTGQTFPAKEHDEEIAELVKNSIAPDAGDIYLVLNPGAFFDPLVVPGFGTSHGTPYLYDRTVPLLVRAPGRVPAGAIQTAPLPFGTFAHTLSDLLGTPPPPAARTAPSLAIMVTRTPP